MSSVLRTLEARGLLNDVSHLEDLDKLLSTESISFYCGFDPTADSLHVGSMLPLLIMKRLHEQGHKPIVVVGSATGMIGDPSGKSEERILLSEDVLEKNVKAIENQISSFMGTKKSSDITVLRNDSWLKELSYVDFLRDIGKLFSVNAMLAKDSVKSRLENREQGISYTEFSYMLLQAYDFYWLHKNHNCRLQIGGSDQWGNITAGLDLIRRIGESPSSYGLTFPLLTTSSGTKFGKSEEGTIWLDPNKTSAYQFYQFWINTADADIVNFLKLFTEIEGEELQELEREATENPAGRRAQKRLAELLTDLVHGKIERKSAEDATKVLFGGSMENISRETLLQIFSHVPSSSYSKESISQGIELTELLVKCGMAQSKGAARRAIEGGGIYLNNQRTSEVGLVVKPDLLIEDSILILRSGKKKYHLVQQEN